MNHRRAGAAVIVLAVAVVAGCGEDAQPQQPCTISDGADGSKVLSCPDGTSVSIPDSSVVVTVEPEGANCANGGIKIQVGVQTPSYVCNGAPGDAITISAEGVGPNCAYGGLKIQVGTSAPGYVCNGANGLSATITAENPGPNCANGGVAVQVGDGAATYVCNGADGLSATVTAESPGPNCANGGVAVQVGDGAATYVCNGADGLSASVTAEQPGTNCATGGVAVQVGDGPATYVCHGADGLSASVSAEGPGTNCATGGVAVQVGASAATYVCNGADGLSASITAESPGTNCATGGVAVQVGAGAATYVCNGADGLSASVTAESPGTNCASGGVAVQVGAGPATYICNRADGLSATITPEPAGANCPTGGVKVQVGTAAPSYVCNGLGGPVAAPSIVPASGTFDAPLLVTLGCSEPGASIYYTTNGANPTASSTLYAGPFNLAASGTVKAIAVIAGRLPSSSASATYSLVNVLYVRPTGNDTTGTGTAAAPFATPNRAATVAATLAGTKQIRVAEGTYVLASTVSVPANTSLLGGHDSATWVRAPSTNVTTLDSANVVTAVELQSGAALVDGLHILGGNLPTGNNCCIDANSNSNATVSHNTCTFAPTGNAAVIGIYAYNGSPIIDGNVVVINGGNNSSAYGMVIGGTGPTVRNNRVTVSYNGRYTYALSLSGSGSPSTLRVYNNVFDGGSPAGIVNGGNAVEVHALSTGSSLLFANNTVRGGSAGAKSFTYWALSIDSPEPGTTITIENNLIFSRSAAVATNGCVKAPAFSSLRYNDLFNCAAGLYSDLATTQTTIAGVNALANAGSNLSFNLAPGTNAYFVNEASDFHLTHGGTAPFTTVKTGGRSLASSFTADLDGATRTASGSLGWSMGAYEEDL